MRKPKANANVIELAAYKRERDRKLVRYIRLDLSAAPHPVITCLVCDGSTEVRNKDNFQFVTVTILSGKKRGKEIYKDKVLRTNTQVVEHFQNVHFESCIQRKRKI